MFISFLGQTLYVFLIRAFYIIILLVYIVILKYYLHCYIIVFACFR
jgi:hypothetical protein